MIKIELTKEEAEVISNYIFRKVCRSENASLKDSYCCPRLYSVYHKLGAALKDVKKEG